MRLALIAAVVVLASSAQFQGIVWANASHSSPPPGASAQSGRATTPPANGVTTPQV